MRLIDLKGIMTNQEIRIAIAESVGWKLIPAGRDTFNVPYPQLANKEYVTISASKLPNYPEDLNAMHEVEKTLNRSQVVEYQDSLATFFTIQDFFSESKYPIDGYIIHATALQRAEAYLRTIGKWKE